MRLVKIVEGFFYLEDSDGHETGEMDMFFLGDAANEMAEALHIKSEIFQDFHIGLGLR